MSDEERNQLLRLRGLFGGETHVRANAWLAKVEREAVRAALDALRVEVEGLPERGASRLYGVLVEKAAVLAAIDRVRP